MRVLEDSDPIAEVHAKVIERYERWVQFFSTTASLKHLVIKKDVQSYTVIPVTASAELITEIKAAAKKKGLLLGEGYGNWKPSSFRIANFPAIKDKEIEILRRFLKTF